MISARSTDRNRQRIGRAGGSPLAVEVPSEPTLVELTRRRNPLLSGAEAHRRARAERSRFAGLGVVDRLLAESGVNEIMINGPGSIWVERNGRLEKLDESLGAGDLDLIIERMLAPLGLQLNRLNPIVDARLPDGSRVNIVAPPLAVDGPVLAVRRFTDHLLPLTAFGPPEVADLLTGIVRSRRSLLIVGATSSGKTTLLNSLSARITAGERIVTIEDTAELRLAGSHVLRLEARPANSEGVGRVSMRQLVTTALRLRPDRLVIGEVRGPEAFDLLLALTAGHAGSLCTCHALDAAAGLRRLQMLASLADADLNPELMRRFVLDAIDVVVQVARRTIPGRLSSRRVVEAVWAVDGPAGSGEHGRDVAGGVGSDGVTLLWRRPPSPQPAESVDARDPGLGRRDG
ncbi:MAG: ATPase, T2SS/T4P/T4SS family [Acidimicrobiia bacterium]|nr:ATPase, T2SS/T4P/T4SS family [Acidimicrobiia bacterium]